MKTFASIAVSNKYVSVILFKGRALSEVYCGYTDVIGTDIRKLWSLMGDQIPDKMVFEFMDGMDNDDCRLFEIAKCCSMSGEMYNYDPEFCLVSIDENYSVPRDVKHIVSNMLPCIDDVIERDVKDVEMKDFCYQAGSTYIACMVYEFPDMAINIADHYGVLHELDMYVGYNIEAKQHYEKRGLW